MTTRKTWCMYIYRHCHKNAATQRGLCNSAQLKRRIYLEYCSFSWCLDSMLTQSGIHVQCSMYMYMTLACTCTCTCTFSVHVYNTCTVYLLPTPVPSGTNIQTRVEVAIKLECVKTNHPQLHIEAKFYKMMQSGGIHVQCTCTCIHV